MQRRQFCLIDAAAMSMDELHGHPVACALLDSLQSASTGVLPSRLRGIFARLRGLGGEQRIKPWAESLTRYYGAMRGKTRNFTDEPNVQCARIEKGPTLSSRPFDDFDFSLTLED